MVDARQSHPFIAFFETPAGDRVPIHGNCSIGRSQANEIVLTDDRVSRRHAIVHVQEATECWLVDLGSGNGTYLNGSRLTRPTRLRDGDGIDIAQFRYVFRQAQVETIDPPTGTFTGATVLSVRASKCWLLVADLENSVQLSQSLPPDQLPVVTGGWLAECKQTIEECGGTLNKFLGDGFLAFWYERGKTAADLARAVSALKRLQTQAEPRFRFVLHYGEVLIGGAGSLGEENLSGREVNLVFRMEKLAGEFREPCLLSEPAIALLGKSLTTREVGQHSLTGFEEPFSFFGT